MSLSRTEAGRAKYSCKYPRLTCIWRLESYIGIPIYHTRSSLSNASLASPCCPLSTSDSATAEVGDVKAEDGTSWACAAGLTELLAVVPVTPLSPSALTPIPSSLSHLLLKAPRRSLKPPCSFLRFRLRSRPFC